MGTRFILGKGFGAENLDQYSFFQKFFILSDNSVKIGLTGQFFMSAETVPIFLFVAGWEPGKICK